MAGARAKQGDEGKRFTPGDLWRHIQGGSRADGLGQGETPNRGGPRAFARATGPLTLGGSQTSGGEWMDPPSQGRQREFKSPIPREMLPESLSPTCVCVCRKGEGFLVGQGLEGRAGV